jgi:hypothetical protein
MIKPIGTVSSFTLFLGAGPQFKPARRGHNILGSDVPEFPLDA